MASTAYGAKVAGMPNRILGQLRTLVRRATSTSAGGASATVDLLLQQYKWADPTYKANEDPLVHWAEQVFDADAQKKALMQRAWQRQIVRVGSTTNPWKAVAGPAGAVVATLQRIGWTSVSASAWATDTKQAVNLVGTPPVKVRRMVRKATTASLWRDLAARNPTFAELAEGAWLEPLRAIMLSRAAPRRGGCARSVAVDGQWPQARLAEHGYVEDDRCQRCFLASGTLRHRHWKCPALEVSRSQNVDENALEMAAGSWPGKCFWDHGLYPMSEFPYVPPVREEQRRRLRGETLDFFTGNIFLDGSGHNSPHCESLNRAGWSAVCMDGIRVSGAMYGTVPGEDQDVPRAELYALRAVLPTVVKPAHIWMDHENHIKAIAKGRAWCTSAKRPNADLWRIVWWNIAELGGVDEGLRFSYTPAHTVARPGEPADVRERRIGNSWADAMAKRGRDLHVVAEAVVNRIKELHGIAKSVAAWLGTAAMTQGASGGPRDSTPRPSRAAASERATRAASAAKRPRRQHVPNPECSTCTVCRRSLKRGWELCNTTECLGPPLRRARWAETLLEGARKIVKTEAAVASAGTAASPEGLPDRHEQACNLVPRRRAPEAPQGVPPEKIPRLQTAASAHAVPAEQTGIGEEERDRGQKRANSATLSRQMAAGHVLFESDGIVWCNKCGAYTSSRLRGLGKVCPGFAKATRKSVLQRFREGRHPVSGAPLLSLAKRARVDDLV